MESAIASVLWGTSVIIFFIKHNDLVSHTLLLFCGIIMMLVMMFIHLVYFLMLASTVRRAVVTSRIFWFFTCAFYLQVALFAEIVCGDGLGFVMVGVIFLSFSLCMICSEMDFFLSLMRRQWHPHIELIFGFIAMGISVVEVIFGGLVIFTILGLNK